MITNQTEPNVIAANANVIAANANVIAANANVIAALIVDATLTFSRKEITQEQADSFVKGIGALIHDYGLAKKREALGVSIN